MRFTFCFTLILISKLSRSYSHFSLAVSSPFFQPHVQYFPIFPHLVFSFDFTYCGFFSSLSVNHYFFLCCRSVYSHILFLNCSFFCWSWVLIWKLFFTHPCVHDFAPSLSLFDISTI